MTGCKLREGSCVPSIQDKGLAQRWYCWVTVFPSDHICVLSTGTLPFHILPAGESAWQSVFLSPESPVVFTDLKLRAGPNSSPSPSKEARNGLSLAGWFGRKTMIFGDWLIPALTLARCVTLEMLICRFKTQFPPLLEVGITVATPKVEVIIELNDHLLANICWRLAVCRHCFV